MKRKTFIKQLMGVGISRNTAAVAAAAAAAVTGTPKAETLQAIMAWRSMFAGDPICDPLIETVLLDVSRKFIHERSRRVCSVDWSDGTDYTVKVTGHRAKDGHGTEILIIDEMHIEPPTKENNGVLLQVEEQLQSAGGGGA
jgi:hypothetical protein